MLRGSGSLARSKALLKNELALISSLLPNQNAEPRTWLVPDLVIDRRRGAAGHAVVGVEAVGRDVDGLDRLGRLDVADVVRQPDVDRDRAVDAGGVAVRLGAVDPGAQRPAGRVDLGVLELGRRRAGHQVDERLIVPVLVQRQVGDLLRRQLRREIGLVGLQQRRVRRDLHRLGQGADLERDVHAHDQAGRHREPGRLVLAEPGQRRLDVVGAGQEVAEGVGAVTIGDGLDFEAGAGVGGGERHAGHGAPWASVTLPTMLP